MESFKQLFNEKSVTYPLDKEAASIVLDIQFNGNMIHIDFTQRQVVEFVSKLKGGFKRKILLQILK